MRHCWVVSKAQDVSRHRRGRAINTTLCPSSCSGVTGPRQLANLTRRESIAFEHVANNPRCFPEACRLLPGCLHLPQDGPHRLVQAVVGRLRPPGSLCIVVKPSPRPRNHLVKSPSTAPTSTSGDKTALLAPPQALSVLEPTTCCSCCVHDSRVSSWLACCFALGQVQPLPLQPLLCLRVTPPPCSSWRVPWRSVPGGHRPRGPRTSYAESCSAPPDCRRCPI